MGRSAAPPPPVVDALARVFGTDPASIAQVRVVEHSLCAFLHLRAIAATRRRRIYLRGCAEEFFTDPILMLHEYCHVLLQWETGALTPWRYLRECLRHGYWRNRYEVEARACAERHHLRLRRLLSGDPQGM